MSNAPDKAEPEALNRADSRVRHDTDVAGAIRAFADRVRSGDLGSLPVVIGLIVIWTVFTALNPVFLSSANLVNMLFDSATVGVIAASVWLLLFAYQDVAYSHQLWWQFELDANAPRGLRAALGSALVLLAVSLTWLLRATPPSISLPDEDALLRARAIVQASRQAGACAST